MDTLQVLLHRDAGVNLHKLSILKLVIMKELNLNQLEVHEFDFTAQKEVEGGFLVIGAIIYIVLQVVPC